QLVLGLVSGQVRTPEQIQQTVIKNSPTGLPIRVGDVSTVVPSVAPVYTAVTANGKPAGLLSVNPPPESNTLAVAGEVHDLIEQLRPTLPAGVHLEPFYDQSTIVHDAIASVRDAVLVGLFLSSVILVIFLHDWGTSLVAGLVIPVTLFLTLIVLKVTEQSFNLMTLGGLAAAVGLVIDDVIVLLENIVLHRDQGKSRLEAIQSALGEMTIPLVGSTITPVVVFLPLVFVTGVEGVFFRALAITMTVALFSSLLLALTWTPTLSQYLMRRERIPAATAKAGEGSGTALEGGIEPEAEEKHRADWLARLSRFYERAIQTMLRRPLALIASSAAIVVLAFVCYQALD